jgi:hypothetical protein
VVSTQSTTRYLRTIFFFFFFFVNVSCEIGCSKLLLFENENAP